MAVSISATVAVVKQRYNEMISRLACQIANPSATKRKGRAVYISPFQPKEKTNQPEESEATA